MAYVKQQSRWPLGDEKGMVLVVGLMLITVLMLLGSTAVIMSTTDMKISANYITGNQAFYAAEAGIDEARARLKADADTAILITDSQPTNANWRAYIGVVAKAQGKGYNSSQHGFYPGLQSALDYTVKIEHKTNASGQILYWGDSNGDGINERNATTGKNIYLVTSYGSASGANRSIEAEVTRVPPLGAPAALYVEAPTSIQGTSTYVNGRDQCGGTDLPGVVTTLSSSTVNKTGNPSVDGSTATTTPPWSVVGSGTNMDVQAMIDSQKDSANYKYVVNTETQTGMHWGIPTQGANETKPSSCGENNIVHYNTQGTNIRLAGGSSGCGLLIVEGDLQIHGGFWWHGMVLVSGSVTFLGGGSDAKNITGAVLAGGSVNADIVGGNANIVYCSSAIRNQTENQPLRRLSWKEQNI